MHYIQSLVQEVLKKRPLPVWTRRKLGCLYYHTLHLWITIPESRSLPFIEHPVWNWWRRLSDYCPGYRQDHTNLQCKLHCKLNLQFYHNLHGDSDLQCPPSAYLMQLGFCICYFPLKPIVQCKHIGMCSMLVLQKRNQHVWPTFDCKQQTTLLVGQTPLVLNAQRQSFMGLSWDSFEGPPLGPSIRAVPTALSPYCSKALKRDPSSKGHFYLTPPYINAYTIHTHATLVQVPA